MLSESTVFLAQPSDTRWNLRVRLRERTPDFVFALLMGSRYLATEARGGKDDPGRVAVRQPFGPWAIAPDTIRSPFNNPPHWPTRGVGLEDPMRAMKTAASSNVMLSSGSNHLIALAQTEETKSLIDAFQPAQNELEAAATDRVLAEKAMRAPRFDEAPGSRASAEDEGDPTPPPAPGDQTKRS